MTTTTTVTTRLSYKTAISTRYLDPTDTRGPRIVAEAGNGQRLTVPQAGNLGMEDNHAAAARNLCAKLGWHGELVGGSTADGYVWVFVG